MGATSQANQAWPGWVRARLTTVALAVPQLGAHKVLHPEGLTHTAPREGIARPVTRAVQLAD